MPAFSLKGLFAFVFVASIACFPLARADIGAAKVMMVAVVLSLLVLVVVGIWTRRPLAFVLVFLSIGYLAIADGGNFPSAERYLPPEWGLERCCNFHTVMDSGRRRSKSLTRWALAIAPNHKDWHCANQPKSQAEAIQERSRRSWTESDPVSDQVLDDLLDLAESSPEGQFNPSVGLTVKLPTMAISSPIAIVTTSRKRDVPQNRSFFIIGHCLVVILTSTLTITCLRAKSKRARRLAPSAN